jgi:hypothetical protein
MIEDVKTPEEVFNPRFLEIVVPDQLIGRQVANRLLIYSGTFTYRHIYTTSDDLSRFQVRLDLSALPGHPVFDGNPLRFISVPDPANPTEDILKATCVASLATIGWEDDADSAVWGVDTARVIAGQVSATSPLDRLLLVVDRALAGAYCGLGRISYQVNLLASAAPAQTHAGRLRRGLRYPWWWVRRFPQRLFNR